MKSFTLSTHYQKPLTATLGGVCLVLFALYIYFLSTSVLYVVARTDADLQMQTMRSEVSELEAEFITAQYAVSESIAQLSGYQPVDQKIFIDRGTPSLVLSRSLE